MVRRIMLLMLILCTPLAGALGISPGSANLNFEPGRQETMSIEIVNSDGEGFTAAVLVTGELSEYITLSDERLTLASGDATKKFTYTIRMPDSFDTPGIHTAEIKVKETVDAKGTEKLEIRPNLAVVHQLFVHVPYPGVYAEASFKAQGAKRGEDIGFFVSVFNLGEQDLTDVHAEFRIFDPEGKEVKSLKTEPKSISAKQAGELVLALDSREFTPGDYTVNATVFYAGRTIQLSASFTVDEFLIDLVSLSVDDYTFGGIAKFSFFVQNIGNRLVEDFYSQIILRDKSGRLVGNLKSYQIDLEKGETKETVAYWDTKDIDIGTYYGILSLNYEDEILEKDIETYVEMDKIDIEIIEVTGLVAGEIEQPKGSSGFDVNVQLTIIIILLVIIAGILVFKKRPISKKK